MDLIPTQFPAQHHPAHAQSGAKQHTGQGMDGHLGGAVDGDMGCDGLAKLHHRQILHDKGIHAGTSSLADERADIAGLPVGNQRIECQMHRDATDMAILDGFGEHLRCEVFRALAGVKEAAAQVDRVGTVLHGSTQRLHGAGGGQKFQHSNSLPIWHTCIHYNTPRPQVPVLSMNFMKIYRAHELGI